MVTSSVTCSPLTLAWSGHFTLHSRAVKSRTPDSTAGGSLEDRGPRCYSASILWPPFDGAGDRRTDDMGEILGLGVTHYPPLTGLDQDMARILRTVLRDPGLPERFRDPANWPEPLRREYGDDGGTTAAAAHRAE